MIGIRLEDGSEFLQTEPDTKISIRLENPIFGDAEALSPGSYSLPFDLPGADRSPHNSRLLKHPDVIGNAESYKIQKATLFFDGVPFKFGNLRAKGYKADSQSISAYFTFGLSSLSADLKAARLRDVIQEAVTISQSPVEKKVYIKPKGSGDRTIQINGQAYTGDAVEDFPMMINAYYNDNMVLDGDIWLPRASLVLVGGPTPNGITTTYASIQMARTITSPITGLPTLQFSGDPHIELNVVGNYDEWEIEADLANYYDGFRSYFDQFVGLTPPDNVRWTLLFNSDLHNGELLKHQDVINAFDENGIMVNDPNYSQLSPTATTYEPRNYNSIQPFLRLKYLLDKIAEAFGFEWEGDFYEDPDTDKRIIDNSVALDLPMPLVGEKKFIFWRRSFDLAELVEDISVVEFLQRLQARYNLAVYFNEATQKVRICYREEIVKSNAAKDITQFSSPTASIDDQRVEGYQLIVAKDSDDAFSNDETVTIGTPEEDIPIPMGRPHLMRTAIVAGKAVTGPWVSRPINEKFTMRIFRDGGLVDVGTYKYASANFNFEGLIDLYVQKYKYWLLAQRNRLSVTISSSFGLRHVMEIDWELKIRFDRSLYLIKSINLELTNWNVRARSVELYTV